MTPIDIPRYVDSQVQLLFWEFDEAIIFICCLGFGIVMHGYFVLLSIALGYGVVKLFRRFKDGALPGILFHLCYWAGFTGLNKIYPDATVRDYFF